MCLWSLRILYVQWPLLITSPRHIYFWLKLWRRFHCITKWDLLWLAKSGWGYILMSCEATRLHVALTTIAGVLEGRVLYTSSCSHCSRGIEQLLHQNGWSYPKRLPIYSHHQCVCVFHHVNLNLKIGRMFLTLTVNRPFTSQATRIAQTPLTSLKIAHGVFCLEQWDVFPQSLWERTTLSRRSAAPVLGRGRTSPYK